jgi:DNA-binding NtrC family response regulator
VIYPTMIWADLLANQLADRTLWLRAKLTECNGNVKEMAARIGMSRQRLYGVLEDHGIDLGNRPHSRASLLKRSEEIRA